jgi:hypothetical protein
MKPKIRLNRNVYLIIIGIVLLAISVQITHSQFVLQFSSNEQMNNSVKQSSAACASIYEEAG